jgi:uncharacterized protein (TIRG00374 family)
MDDRVQEVSQPPAPASRRRTRDWHWLGRAAQLVAVSLVLLLAWRLLEQIGWSQLWLRILGVGPAWLTATGIALTARFVLLYWRWLLALEAIGVRPPWVFGLASQIAAVLINHLTPTARIFGGVFRARCISRKLQRPFPVIFATVLVDQVSHQLVLGALTWLSLIALARWTGLSQLAWVLGLGLATVTTALAIWRRRRKAETARPLARLLGLRAEKRGRRLGPLMAGGRELISTLGQAFSDVGLQLRMAALGLAIFTLNVAAQWAIFESLDTPVPLFIIGATIAVGLSAGLLTGTPGGIATTEAAMVGFYVALGIDEISAAAGVLLYRGLHYLLVLALGLPCLVYCELTTGRRPATTSERARQAPSDTGTTAGGSPPDSSE